MQVYSKNGGLRYKIIDLTALSATFISASANCPIRQWDLFDSDGITKLVDSEDIKILNPGEKIAVVTEYFNWSKKIYLRNKILNPNKVCNWKCYKKRYSNLSSKNLEEV